MRRRGREVDESGVELVELALAVLPLALIVMGAIDLGRVFILSSQLRQAAEAGALYAQDYPTQVSNPGGSTTSPCADPNNITYQVASAQGYTSSADLPSDETVTVTDETTGMAISGCQTGTVSPGDTVEVEVSEPFSLITPLISSITGPITVHATVQVVAQ